MKVTILLLFLFQVPGICLSQDNRIPVQVNNPGKQFKLIGQLGEEMGDTFSVRGVIVYGHTIYDHGPNLFVQVIRDSATQEFLKIHVSPIVAEFGDSPHISQPVYLPKIVDGATYRLRVYETGEFVGTPLGALKEWDNFFQTTGYYFKNKLVVVSGEKIDPIEWSPANFLGQNALLSGTAKNENDTAVIQTSKWKLRLVGSRKWTDSEIGKLAEVYGKIQETNTNAVYNVENGQSRLVRLEDQLGKTVKLRGRAISMNGYWWFNYRGRDIYVEKMEELPGWTVENHFRPMEITGILEQEELPSIDQISIKTNRDHKLYYIVRKASWTPIDRLLAPELPR